MKTLERWTCVACLLGFWTSAAEAQNGNGTWIKTEEDAARKVLELWQQTDNETVRKQAASTLQQMSVEIAPTLAILLAAEIEQARVQPGQREKHLASARLLAGILGRLRNLAVREEKVRSSLIAVVQNESDLPVEVRQTAIEALGRIFAGRSLFLILNREEFWLKEVVSQKTPRDMAQFLQNEAATLKEKFNLAKPPDADKARELILVIRNVGRKFHVYRNVIALLSELESLKDKTLSERVKQNLADIESNLQMVVAGKSAAEAAVRAEQAAHDLYEEMERTAYSIIRWQNLNKATSEVIGVLRHSLDDGDVLIRFTAVEALGRIYGKLEF